MSAEIGQISTYIQSLQSLSPNINKYEPTDEEVKKAIKTLRNNKYN